MKILARHFLIIFSILFSGCAHQISFQEVDYSIAAQKFDAGLTAVVDHHTLNNEITIRSFMTGIAHSWNAQPGQMVKQVADIEFPQMVKHYEFSQVFREPQKGSPRITLELTVPQYDFADFQATFNVRAKAYSSEKKVLFDKSYEEIGFSQGAKMFWAGPFGMKSAIRQSSLDALKKIFISLRRDLAEMLLSNNTGKLDQLPLAPNLSR